MNSKRDSRIRLRILIAHVRGVDPDLVDLGRVVSEVLRSQILVGWREARGCDVHLNVAKNVS